MTFTDAMAPVAALALLFAGIVLLMWLGWRSRRRAQADVPAPAPDADLADRPGGLAHRDVPAVYVATTRAERPLERIVAHGLGVRSPASLDLAADGSWRIRRTGAPCFCINADRVLAVTTAPGMAGKWVGGQGLLVIRWQDGPEHPALDTGLRLQDPADHHRLLDAWKELA